MEQEKKRAEFHPPRRGRGAVANPPGRFERFGHETDAETYDALCAAGLADDGRVTTQVFPDRSRSIISTNDSPDIGMEATLNPYRGCEHGCVYCYARPSHEYLGLSAGTDFESRIFVKADAPALLRRKLSARSWVPRVITLSGITDSYQPLERSLRITRGCLEVLRDFGNPAVIITKNHLVTRDIDILREMAALNIIQVVLSVTTLDGRLARRMEPRTATPQKRLQAIAALADARIPVGVMVGPVVPGLTEHEIPAILRAAADAGAESAHYTMLRLPHGVKDIFQTWVRETYPGRADKILNRIREMRGGKLNDSRFGARMRGTGVHADHIAAVFALYRKRFGLTRRPRLSLTAYRRDPRQLRLL